jgi:hypothetical protein
MGEPIWYIPVGLVAVAIAWAIRKIKPVILQFFIAVIAPAFLSAVLAVVPQLLYPSPPGEGAWGWTVILAATWALVSVPSCLVAVIVINRVQRHSQGNVNKRL